MALLLAYVFKTVFKLSELCATLGGAGTDSCTCRSYAYTAVMKTCHLSSDHMPSLECQLDNGVTSEYTKCIRYASFAAYWFDCSFHTSVYGR